MNRAKWILALLTILLLNRPAFSKEQNEVSQLENRKQQIEEEAAVIRSEIEADKKRLEALQKQIDEWNAKNAKMDQKLQKTADELEQ